MKIIENNKFIQVRCEISGWHLGNRFWYRDPMGSDGSLHYILKNGVWEVFDLVLVMSCCNCYRSYMVTDRNLDCDHNILIKRAIPIELYNNIELPILEMSEV